MEFRGFSIISGFQLMFEGDVFMSVRGRLHLQYDSPSAIDLLKKSFMLCNFSSYLSLFTLHTPNEVKLLQARIAQMLVCFNPKDRKAV